MEIKRVGEAPNKLEATSPTCFESEPKHTFHYAAHARSCGGAKRELPGAPFAGIEQLIGIVEVNHIDAITWSYRWRTARRALRSIQKPKMAQDPLDDGGVIDEAIILSKLLQRGEIKGVGFENLLNQARSRAFPAVRFHPTERAGWVASSSVAPALERKGRRRYRELDRWPTQENPGRHCADDSWDHRSPDGFVDRNSIDPEP